MMLASNTNFTSFSWTQ